MLPSAVKSDPWPPPCKGGLHVAAVEQAPQTFEHVDPATVGGEQRILVSELSGTGAVTRVLLDASDGDDVWGSIGVSENIIEASWEALVDSIEYGMVRSQQK